MSENAFQAHVNKNMSPGTISVEYGVCAITVGHDARFFRMCVSFVIHFLSPLKYLHQS